MNTFVMSYNTFFQADVVINTVKMCRNKHILALPDVVARITLIVQE